MTQQTIRVLVCGGRDYANDAHLRATLYALHMAAQSFAVVITGGARGADALAYQWAIDQGIPTIVESADWQLHGRAAGPIRNQRMLDLHKPDLVLAFAGGRGTADMLRRAHAAGVPVVECDNDLSIWGGA